MMTCVPWLLRWQKRGASRMWMNWMESVLCAHCSIDPKPPKFAETQFIAMKNLSAFTVQNVQNGAGRKFGTTVLIACMGGTSMMFPAIGRHRAGASWFQWSLALKGEPGSSSRTDVRPAGTDSGYGRMTMTFCQKGYDWTHERISKNSPAAGTRHD